jgi:hypothetical protein
MDWLQRHMLFTVFFVSWMFGIVSWVTWRVFSPEPPVISGTTAAALATVYGLPAVAVGLWKWRGELISKRGKE